MRKKLIWLILIILAAHTLAPRAQEINLDRYLRILISNETNYYTPSATELDQAAVLFHQMFVITNITPELQAAWQTLGFQLQTVTWGGQQYWLIAEPTNNQAGRGFFLFRPSTINSWKLVLQAPHPKNDLYTGQISLYLFTNTPARALSVATVSRYLADMAHLENTYFQAFTIAFGSTFPTGRVVQIHGFAPTNYPDLSADMVLSAATNSPPPWLTNYARSLAEITGFSVAAYPYDTRYLGGTRNAQAAGLRQFPEVRFLHIEISRPAREILYTNAYSRGSFSTWLETISQQ